MDTDLKIYRCLDYAVILSIIKTEVIWNKIIEDNVKDFIPDILNEYWLCVVKNKIPIGCYRIQPVGAICCKGHVHILPKHRKHSKKATRLALKWVFENIDGLNKVVCEIPVLYQNVIRHVEDIGFIHEGSNNMSYLKKGKICGVEHFGITRTDYLGDI